MTISVICVDSESEKSCIQINTSAEQNLKGTNLCSRVMKTLIYEHLKFIRGSHVFKVLFVNHFSLSPICEIIVVGFVDAVPISTRILTGSLCTISLLSQNI